MRIFVLQETGIAEVIVSPDGRHVACLSVDGTVHLVQVATGATRALPGHRVPRSDMAFSPDGRYVMATSYAKTLLLWEVASGAVRALEGHRVSASRVAFSPDSGYAAAATEEHAVVLWDAATGTWRVLGQHGNVWGLAFSPDSRHLASWSFDNTLCLWDVPNGACRTLEGLGHGSGSRTVMFSPDGRNIVLGSWDKLTLLAMESDVVRTLGGSGDRPLQFSPGGRYLVYRGWASEAPLMLLEVASGIVRKLNSATDTIAFSPDGRYLVFSSRDRALRLWEVESLRQLASLEGDFRIDDFHLASNGKVLVTVDRNQRVHVIDILLDDLDKATWLTRRHR
jgi:WD40 repeat protein